MHFLIHKKTDIGGEISSNFIAMLGINMYQQNGDGRNACAVVPDNVEFNSEKLDLFVENKQSINWIAWV